MSTIYVFDDEVPALVTAATGDKLLISDVSTKTKKAITVANLQSGVLGASASDTVGFYGETKIAQPASASQTAITAGATTTAHKTLTIALRKALMDLGLIKGAA
jgi:hypothetical protein